MPARKPTRALAALLVRDIEAGIAAAIAAGHPAPPVELRHLDGLSRSEAAALSQWAAGIPEIGAALRDRRHPQHREVAAYRDLVQYFSADHPAREDGSPEPWREPLGEGFLSFVLGAQGKLDPEQANPAEAMALLDYALIRGDLHAARFDKAHPQHEAVKAEIAALAERATQPAAAPPGDSARSSSAPDGRDAAQDRVLELGAALHSKSLSPIVKRQIADEIAGLSERFPGLEVFTTAGMSAADIEALRADTVRYMPHLTDNDAAIELTEGLAEGRFRGSARFAARAALADALSATAVDGAATPGAAKPGGAGDFRSAKTLAINEELRTMRGGPARRARLDDLAASLAADQAAHDAGGAAAPVPRSYVTAPTPTVDGRPPAPARAGRGPMEPQAIRAALKGLSPAQRSARLDEMFGVPTGTDSAGGEAE